MLPGESAGRTAAGPSLLQQPGQVGAGEELAACLSSAGAHPPGKKIMSSVASLSHSTSTWHSPGPRCPCTALGCSTGGLRGSLDLLGSPIWGGRATSLHARALGCLSPAALQQQPSKHGSPLAFYHPRSAGEGREATAGEHLGSIAHCLAINVSAEDRRDVRY